VTLRERITRSLSGVVPTHAPDTDVIAKPQELDSVLVSLNGDFAYIVTYRPSDYRGIVCDPQWPAGQQLERGTGRKSSVNRSLSHSSQTFEMPLVRSGGLSRASRTGDSGRVTVSSISYSL
jgi:hypothetical protein